MLTFLALQERTYCQLRETARRKEQEVVLPQYPILKIPRFTLVYPAHPPSLPSPLSSLPAALAWRPRR